MPEKLKPQGLSLASLRQYVELEIREIRDYPWLETTEIELDEIEQVRLRFIQDDLRYRQVQLMNEATVWARAIYPLLMLAEEGSIHAYSGILLQAAFPGFEIDVIADGVLGQESSGTVESPYLVVVEAKRGVEGQNPLTQLYLEVLSAAHLNWQRDRNPNQIIFGCYTVADVWTFIRAEVSGFEQPKPTLRVEFSREFFEKAEAPEICKILKKMVRQHPQTLVAE